VGGDWEVLRVWSYPLHDNAPEGVAEEDDGLVGGARELAGFLPSACLRLEGVKWTTCPPVGGQVGHKCVGMVVDPVLGRNVAVEGREACVVSPH
jgi:hypothetical protein